MIVRRLSAYLIDLVLLSGVYLIVWCFLPNHAIYIGCYLFALFFCKDGFTGQSIGKKVCSLQIVQDRGQISPLKALARNIFYIVWPIEVIMLFATQQRIGDIVTKTRVVKSNSTPKKTNYSCIALAFGLGCIILLLMIYIRNNTLISLLY